MKKYDNTRSSGDIYELFIETGFQFQVISRNIGKRNPRSELAYDKIDEVLGQQLQSNVMGRRLLQ